MTAVQKSENQQVATVADTEVESQKTKSFIVAFTPEDVKRWVPALAAPESPASSMSDSSMSAPDASPDAQPDALSVSTMLGNVDDVEPGSGVDSVDSGVDSEINSGADSEGADFAPEPQKEIKVASAVEVKMLKKFPYFDGNRVKITEPFMIVKSLVLYTLWMDTVLWVKAGLSEYYGSVCPAFGRAKSFNDVNALLGRLRDQSQRAKRARAFPEEFERNECVPRLSMAKQFAILNHYICRAIANVVANDKKDFVPDENTLRRALKFPKLDCYELYLAEMRGYCASAKEAW